MNKQQTALLIGLILSCSPVFAITQTITNTTNTPANVIINNQGPGIGTANTTTTTITTTTNPQPTPLDDDIVSSVYKNYAKAPALIGTSLTVSSLNGIVTINGTVTAQAQADAAVEQAKSVAGVKDVRSNIQVTTNPDLNKPKSPVVPNY